MPFATSRTRGSGHLYVMYGCPWAHRTLIVRSLKGLERAIDFTAVDHRLGDAGWVFSPERPDPLGGATSLRELYLKADPSYAGRITVPVLWDKAEQTIVNNESAEIIRMLNGAFDAFAEHPGLDLYPEPLRPEIVRWNENLRSGQRRRVRRGIRHHPGCVRGSRLRVLQRARRARGTFAAHRYLVGDQPTEADWRLFPTLIRFEWVYHGLFKCNLKRLVDYPNLFAYTRELFQWPGIAATVNERHIRDGYYSMTKLNPTGITPAGPLVDFRTPHGRERGPRASAVTRRNREAAGRSSTAAGQPSARDS